MEQLPHQAQPQQDLTTFYHQSLDPNESEAIRLVRIKPELHNGLIDCEIWDATMEVDYCTLSYVCGHADNVKQILLNGQLYHVKPNLWEFLECARERFAEKAFWIDALSIHQGDIQERSHQVQMMSKIYTRTQQVHVWLGRDRHHGAYALDLINACYWMTGEPLIEACLEDDVFQKGFMAIHRANYWNRAWCLQEFVLPKMGLLLMGRGSVQLEKYDIFIKHCCDALELIADDRHDIRLMFSPVVRSPSRDLWLMRTRHVQSGSDQDIPAQQLLVQDCSDIRDRIYSTLPFHKWDSVFTVDYSMNPFELLLEYELNTTTGVRPTVERANILHLNPIAIMLYAQSARQFKCPGGDHLVTLPCDAESQHLQTAASTAQLSRWYRVGEPSRAMPDPRVWQDACKESPNLSIEETLKENQITIHAPCFTFLKNGRSDVYLVIATERDGNQNSQEGSDTEPTDAGSVTPRDTCCVVSGRYVTKCYKTPVIVYYALLEHPKLRFTERPSPRPSIKHPKTPSELCQRQCRGS